MNIGIYNNSSNWKEPSTKSNSFFAKFKRASWNLVERREKKDMIKIFKAIYPKSEFLEISNIDKNQKKFKKNLEGFKKIILISNDPLAHGQIKTIRFLLKLKNKDIVLLNSYKRQIKINKLILFEITLKQILERYMVLEFVLILPLFILSLFLGLLDCLRRDEKY
tara:strand:- start:318 stop:812 length:495 start_codon:yes stop_codon:yes gene_type:complete